MSEDRFFDSAALARLHKLGGDKLVAGHCPHSAQHLRIADASGLDIKVYHMLPRFLVRVGGRSCADKTGLSSRGGGRGK